MPKRFSKPHLSRLINGDISPESAPARPETTRLDLYLVAHYSEYNRSTLQKFIKDSLVRVNGEITTKSNYPIAESDSVQFSPPPPVSTEKPPVPIIYEDDNVLVLDKPVGLLSMSKGDYNPELTLEDYGLLVHRLDRGTSGVIILAKNPETQKQLQKQFQSRKAHKTYYAVVVGHPDPAHALIDIPLARNLARPTTFQPSESGRPALTEYEVVDRSDKYSLVKLTPTTGRTHQLRVHLSHIGTPILGDPIYGTDSSKKSPAQSSPESQQSTPPPPRLYLHATSLEITIPGGLRKTFTSNLPEDFTNVLKQP